MTKKKECYLVFCVSSFFIADYFSILSDDAFTVKGDSYTRHIVNPGTTPPDSDRSCEVLVTGNNDLAVGEQHHHLETVLVNAFIEESAAWHNTRLLGFDGISRRFFTRHGQHLSMMGKRLLERMIVECLISPRPSSPSPSGLAQPSRPSSSSDHHFSHRACTCCCPGEVGCKTAIYYICGGRRRIPSGSNSKCTVFLGIPPAADRQSDTDKTNEIQLMCEDQETDLIVVTQNGFNNENFHLCKTPNSKLAKVFSRYHSKRGGVAAFLKYQMSFSTFLIQETVGIFNQKIQNFQSLEFIGLLADTKNFVLNSNPYLLTNDKNSY
ncbi:hypothetical protein J6590_083265 [Homalodisca vitripennis]|nr:hypothetical protein J6590_083265 [Homalodisca vitripennis]